jgi:peroxiredoxin Q/BCP
LSGYRDNYEFFQERDTEVFGISADGYASHAEFREQLELPFDLLSDWDRTVMPAYGAFSERTKTATRWSFLIDKEGVIRYTQHTGLNEPRDVEAMMAELEKIYQEQ